VSARVLAASKEKKRKEKGTRGCPFKGDNVVQPNTSTILVKILHEWGKFVRRKIYFVALK
jgi:hypothetical protein